jgi:dolichol-phosphate mannosyltransferase
MSNVLSLILPTYNESGNLAPILAEIASALKGVAHEIIVVDDDSPDGTWQKAEELMSVYPHLRVIRRRAPRGLSPAVVDGFRAAKGSIFAVMDADGQHDPRLLSTFIQAIEQGGDIVIGSRYVSGGSVGDWKLGRRLISLSGTLLTRLSLGVTVHDPLSGFFAIRREAVDHIIRDFHPEGFKILLDLLVRLPRSIRVREFPFVFRTRLHGESKLTFSVHLAVLKTLLPLLCARFGFGIFLVLALTLSLVLLPRALALSPLYRSAELRQKVAVELQRTADEEGWLLSDMPIIRADERTIDFAYQPHRPGREPISCMRIDLATHQQISCDAR